MAENSFFIFRTHATRTLLKACSVVHHLMELL